MLRIYICEGNWNTIYISLAPSSGYCRFLSEGTETLYMKNTLFYLIMEWHLLWSFRFVTLAPPRSVSSLLAKVSTQPLAFLGPYGGWLPR